MRTGWTVRVPASSANLGPGFDALAVALDRHLVVGDRGEPAADGHPAVRAFRAAGGEGPISVRADFPGGRGLGFSGAARIGGLVAAHVQRGGALDEVRDGVLHAASEMEGHADNVAASLLGGVVVAAGDRALRVAVALDVAVVCWIPDVETATSASRRSLPETVAFADAVFNVGRASLLVAALGTGDAGALRAATEDRLHQDLRFARVPESRAAWQAALEAGALCAWLSGSGPTVAAFAARDAVAEIAGALPTGGRVEVMSIAEHGAVVEHATAI